MTKLPLIYSNSYKNLPEDIQGKKKYSFVYDVFDEFKIKFIFPRSINEADIIATFANNIRRIITIRKLNIP